MSSDSSAKPSFGGRFDRLLELVGEGGADGILVTSAANRRYLSGFTGSSAGLVISTGQSILVTDGRYITQASAECPDFEIVRHTGPILRQIAESVLQTNMRRLAFDPALTTVADHRALAAALDGGCELVEATGLVESLRSVKNSHELRLMRRAIALADEVMAIVEDIVEPGVREIDVAVEIERAFREGGAEGPSFPVIVAAGVNSAMPHHRPARKVIERGEPVVVDMGALVAGYCSDMTRTFCAGGRTKVFDSVYDVVLEAQLAAIDGARDGLAARECDRLARARIEQAGFGERFGHGTGHGIGLEVHESPRVAATSTDTLRTGMVHSIEPGIYLPEWGGVRIEDLVLVGEDGAEVLSTYRK